MTVPRRLGEILVELGACTPERLKAALQSQVLLGGRLGTNLLEQGAVTEAQLAAALARRHGVPALCGELSPDPDVLRLLTAEQADHFQAVPYALRGHRLTVLCSDPSDLTRVDELAFLTGKQVEPVVLPESRLFALLRQHYGVARPMRAIEVRWARERTGLEAPSGPAAPGEDLMGEAEFEHLYVDRPPDGLSAPAHGPRATPRRPPPLPGLRAAPPEEGVFITSEELLAELQAEASAVREARGEERLLVAAPEPPLPPLGFAEAMAALDGVADRGAIARVVLRFARSRFQRALLLTVHARGADGWEGVGEGLTPQTVARVHVPRGLPGLVQTAIETRSHVLGPLARTESNIRLLRALGGGVPRNALAMPILARGQVVNVLYADAGRGRMIDPDDVGELLILAARISRSYDVLLSRAR